ncbi:hypothetical protein JFC72_22390 [Enterobacter hormaechei]|uniref:hypothetical protein n=1 Tax=Enterobacter hormaechei TaxID=158836 RepID=UPI0018E6B672|nr:hypothetical protein [Enterobacter hormaechei]MBI8959619.1 hypothetical protein [Enterobacter hormaechei]MCU2740029.1 hypothetical protein [Enterobacter hormaechei subsp. xiangfangensis]
MKTDDNAFGEEAGWLHVFRKSHIDNNQNETTSNRENKQHNKRTPKKINNASGFNDIGYIWYASPIKTPSKNTKKEDTEK